MKEIVIAQPLGISKETLQELSSPLIEEGFHITVWDNLPENQEELGQRLEKADLAVIANYPLKKEALNKASSLKYICVAFTGVDHVDIDTCRERNIAVSNCAGYSTESVAELTLGMILSLYRKLAEGREAAVGGRTGLGLRGIEIKGRTVGIIGTGAIGYRTAELAKAFGASVIGFNRSHNHPDLQYSDLDTLLKTSDIVTIHLPLTKETKHFINEEKLSLMKKDAILINTARGGIVDNEALARFLQEGKIAGAGIDVFDMEPPLPQDYPLLHSPHTILTPHVGFDTQEAMKRRAVLVFDNLKSWIAGRQKNVIC